MPEEPSSQESIKWSRLSALSTLAGVIVGGAGLIFLVCQLNQLSRQNDLLNENMKQTYRPVGVVKQANPDILILHYLPSHKKDRFSFIYDAVLTNQTDGILSYLGYIYYLTTKEVSFRNDFLEGRISDVKKDSIESYARGITLVKNDKQVVFATYEDVSFERKYFLYIICFYQDQAGNLYDTEHLAVFPFKEPQLTDEGLQPKLEGGGLAKQLYHAYTGKEIQQLVQRLKKIGHPVAELISSSIPN